MPSTAPRLSDFYDIKTENSSDAVVRLKGRVDVKNAAAVLKSLKTTLKTISCDKRIADLKSGIFVRYLKLRYTFNSQHLQFQILRANNLKKEDL